MRRRLVRVSNLNFCSNLSVPNKMACLFNQKPRSNAQNQPFLAF
jgi:hypothetical protein